jgi:phosphopantetheinyl transferase (holo-ACP synthase)
MEVSPARFFVPRRLLAFEDLRRFKPLLVRIKSTRFLYLDGSFADKVFHLKEKFHREDFSSQRTVLSARFFIPSRLLAFEDLRRFKPLLVRIKSTRFLYLDGSFTDKVFHLKEKFHYQRQVEGK